MSSMTTIASETECKLCTAPTGGSDLCGFCADYAPPLTDHQRRELADLTKRYALCDPAKVAELLSLTVQLWALEDRVRA